MAAGHAELLALAPKLAFCECWNEHLKTYVALNSSLKGLIFGDHFTWSDYMTGNSPGIEQARMLYISNCLKKYPSVANNHS